MSTFQTVKIQIAAFHQALHCLYLGKKDLHFEQYNLTPLDMYNELSQVYCIKPEGRIY